MKKKLNLRIDGLDVETFTVAEVPEEARGTVAAAEYSVRTAQYGSCGGYTCDGASCFTSCSPGGQSACTCPIFDVN